MQNQNSDVERNRYIRNLEKIAREDIQKALKRSAAVHRAKQCLRDYLEREERLVLDGIEIDFECSVRLETRGKRRVQEFNRVSGDQKTTGDPSAWRLSQRDRIFLKSLNISLD